jgi:hypothetical protein
MWMILQRPAVNCCTAQQKKTRACCEGDNGFLFCCGNGIIGDFLYGFCMVSHWDCDDCVHRQEKKSVGFVQKQIYLSLADPHLHLPKHKQILQTIP